MKIDIIGAGMSGLLAANIMRRHEVIVHEKQDELPNNHHAVLRFRTPDVGNVLGIQFKKVNMLKTYVPHLNIVADSLSYSRKTTDMYRSDRSIIEGTVTAERWIAPTDLISQMSKDVKIEYGEEFDFKKTKHPTISTIPMSLMMKILNYPESVNFKSIPGIVFTGRILDCDAYVSVLFPGPQLYSRATITGNRLMIEFPDLEELPESIDLVEAYLHLGLNGCVILDGEFKKQQFFKIIDINDVERKKFQRWATVNYNIYSLGRYATWRPKLLLDDIIEDVRKIESWIIGGKI